MSSGGSHYRPPLADIAFVMERWIDAPEDWKRMARYESLDAESARMVADAAGLFCADTLSPINSAGDLQGCTLEGGKVTTPDGFREAYRAYTEAGWTALACDPEVGGQGLPQLLDAMLNEMIVSGNHAWAMYLGILHGAYACLYAHASESLKATYLPHLVSGNWLATMCLTEPQAGSDLGLLRAQAKPQDDGSFRIDGNKIFISGGEQDLTENNVHLVLARLPDAPPGTKGISLFLVPKLIPQSDGSFEPNAVFCDGIERKMGIKGSATCAMRFENAQGWLIGEPHRGLAAMFIMMNSARLHVGLQGLGHAEMAYQLALAYAQERQQMLAQPRPAGATGKADAIIHHAPMRRILMDLRVWTEGMRALGYWAGHVLDLAEHAPDAQERASQQALAALLTPVIKSFFTERGFELASEALQVFGGYGYVHEYRIEQIVRDSRIAMIYEGTNQIQALDLLQRKVLTGRGDGLAPLVEVFRQEAALAAQCPAAQAFGQALGQWSERLQIATQVLAQDAQADAELPARAAEDYLRLVGTIAMAFAWCRAARVADDEVHARKRDSAQYFFDHVLVDAEHWLRKVQAARHAIPAIR
ncbi:acyl-CoA dehydrogenase [Diaphorobacter sp. HDW4B]|uniref:acyl-CoA dehydrogenase family protein n=1 Tax=Diaphorobacter sp. HDW4B TaxID=2714925 RepID=UPI00140ABBE0|nr:acyl-CoA dehydrogenase family protein [Diaphorobacter sp. HDW4B]QIL70671.1 acyl-CoA dehydrogenase [Diaphorobacter sp. HDW4B]